MDFIEVARVVKPHGLVGELGVLMHWEGSDALELVERVRVVLLDGSTRDFALAKVKPSGKGYLVKFVGVDDRNAAEALRGAKLLVNRAVLPPLEEGETFLSDLVGQVVLGPDGIEIGRVVDIASYPSVDSLVIEMSDGARVEQPLVEDWVKPFEPGKSVIELTSLDGLVG
ncbi:MAG: ribosome maturation factor RimM [Polyangiaceae bacterium]